jgi:hypothetical protein
MEVSLASWARYTQNGDKYQIGCNQENIEMEQEFARLDRSLAQRRFKPVGSDMASCAGHGSLGWPGSKMGSTSPVASIARSDAMVRVSWKFIPVPDKAAGTTTRISANSPVQVVKMRTDRGKVGIG